MSPPFEYPDDNLTDEVKTPLSPTWDIIPILKNVTLNIPRGKLIGIVGPIGSGKSSLLQALLRELPIESGSMSVNGKLSYACQEPWVFAGSVRQNILFGEEMDRQRYDSVIKACALEKDFQQFEYEDRTLVGERGASLSGGQKARIKYFSIVFIHFFIKEMLIFNSFFYSISVWHAQFIVEQIFISWMTH